MREQLQPNPDKLTAGAAYTWKFQTTTHLGEDAKGTQRLIWQLHDLNSATSPITVLGVQNLSGTQVWYFASCGSNVARWTGAYTEGATDTWEIEAVPTDGSGSASLYRNGSLVNSCSGKTTNTNSPWWNFGPYVWDWTRTPDPSVLSSASITFDYMQLY